MKERKRVCCNCGNNIRKKIDNDIKCYCAIHGHYIGYVACHTDWCNRWRKDKKEK